VWEVLNIRCFGPLDYQAGEVKLKVIKTILPICVTLLWLSACQSTGTLSEIERLQTPTAETNKISQQIVTETRTLAPHTTITPTIIPTFTQIPIVDRRQFAYQTFEQHLYLVNIDNYSELQLDQSVPRSVDRYYWGFSPDGRMVLFGTLDDKGKIIHLEDDIVVPLEFSVYGFAWTIDGSRLLLQFGERDEQTGRPERRSILIDSTTGNIVHEIENIYISVFSFLPDNSLIISDGQSFYIHEPLIDTNGQIAGISETPYRQIEVSIKDRGINNFKVSPDGNKIAFRAANNNGIGWADLYIIGLDGSELKNCTQGLFAQSADRQLTYEQFAWSPDSTKIAFYTYNYFDDLHIFDIFLSNQPRIYVVEVDNCSWTEITDENYPYGRSPSWSPDGQKLMFVGAQGIQDWPDLILCNSDGKDKQVVPGNYPIDNAIFRPGLQLP
jgi:hypothetical protein